MRASDHPPLESLDPIERLVSVAADCRSGGNLDRLCPLATTPSRTHEDRWECPRENVERFLAPVVMLESVAESIGNKLRGAGQVYVLGDATVRLLLEHDDQSCEQPLNQQLEALACIGVLFRFPVALKFAYDTLGLTQLRSNSWGHAACERFGLLRTPAFLESTARFEAMIEPHRERYAALVAACQSARRPLDVEYIHSLNRDLPIPLLT